MTETGQESLSQDKSPKTPFWPEWNLDLHKIAKALVEHRKTQS
jgi:hypothetical protein